MPTRRNFSKGLLAGTLFSAFPPLRQPTAQERKDRSEIAFYSASRLSRLV